MVAMSHDGERALVAGGALVRFADGRELLRGARACALALVEGEAWIVIEDGGEHALRRFDAAGEPLEPALRLGPLGGDIRITATRLGVRSALIEGDRAVYVREQMVEDLGPRGRDRRVLLGGRGVAERRGGALVLRRTSAIALPADLAAATIVGGAMVLDGAAALLELERAGCRTAVVLNLQRGTVQTRIRLGEAPILAVAERAGLVVLGRGAHVAICDLRAGRCIGERILPAPVRACAIDADGTRLLVLDAAGTLHALAASMADWTVPATSIPDDADPAPGEPAGHAPGRDEFGKAAPRERLEQRGDDTARDIGCELAGERIPRDQPGAGAEHAIPVCNALTDGAGTGAETDSQAWDGVTFPTELRAFGPKPTSEALSSTSLAAYQADVFAWIVSLCRTALAGVTTPTRGGDRLDTTRAAERDSAVRLARWGRPGAPHVELTRAFGLSPMALSVLMLAAAPQIWGELARTYRALAAGPGRSLIDELLIAQLLEANLLARAAISRELDPEAPLVRQGLIIVAGGLRPFAALSVHPVIARRIAGVQAVAPVASPAVPLEDIIGPRQALAALAARLVDPADTPVRVVIRGQAGTGRGTIAEALAARAGRRIGRVEVDATLLAADGALTRVLRDVSVCGDLPCVRLDDLGDEPVIRTRMRVALDGHAGPLLLCASADGELPLSPGYHALEMPALDERQRREAWRRALRARALDPGLAARFAARFAVGPGTITRACATVTAGAPTPAASLVAALRQHRVGHLQEIAGRVAHLASWDELVVPDDLLDALREIIARVRHRDTVLDAWGMARVASTARGVTALFQGGPGTGKTMAAGVVARELGYELWRVDLSKVVSKWIGETEKHLGRVLDAAEDGEIVLLFDEADSLFGKRTQVTSSHDRNANLETNYLLQRLDDFSGVAILTTNLGTAIDPAFRRRLSVQIQFPFPDEIERVRLWRAHLPGSLPGADGVDLGELAARYSLSGGYIRNASLRAAFLAADSDRPITTETVHRAIALEYERSGRLGDGRLE
jgi:AAA+ superfamily predicted ATPase